MFTMYEAHARERQREMLADAAHRRLVQQVATARLWHRLAMFAVRRADRSQLRLDESAAEYQLVA